MSVARTSRAITAHWGQRRYNDICNFHTFAGRNLSAAKVDRKCTREDRETRMYPIEDMHLAVFSRRNIVETRELVEDIFSRNAIVAFRRRS